MRRARRCRARDIAPGARPPGVRAVESEPGQPGAVIDVAESRPTVVGQRAVEVERDARDDVGARRSATEPREGAVHGAQRTTPKQRVQAAGDGAQISKAVDLL